MSDNSTTGLADRTPVVPETQLRLGNDSLTTWDVARVARGGGGVNVGLDELAANRMAASVTLRAEIIASEQPIYGVTTGFGDSNVHQIAPEKASALQQNLIQYHLLGSGPAAAPDVVRATILVRANCLSRGYSGIRRDVVDLMREFLAHDILPVIPERGSVGASGDLVPLCYLANALAGRGDVTFRGRCRPATEVLSECELRPVTLEAKEALALINGTSFMSAYAALALQDAVELVRVAEVCTALCAEVLCGNSGHFDPLIHAQKPHPGQVHSAARIAALLAGSGLARDHRSVLGEIPTLDGRHYQRLDNPIQERYSVRCAPHVVGVLADTVDWGRRWVDVEINSSNDNPLFDVATRAVYNGGNFYGGHVGHAMDSLKLAVANVGDLLDRQLALIVDERFNNGLTPNLVARRDAGDWHAGLHHGFKGAQIACSALVAEALKLTMPATAFSRSTEAHNQDKVSMGTIAARDARTAVELVTDVAAIHLAALCQAAELRGPDRLAPGTRAAYRLVREHVGFVDQDRRLDGELAGLADLIRTGAFGVVADGVTEPAPADPAVPD